MAHFRKLMGVDQAGFDEAHYLQVVPVNGTTRIYLVAGSDLTVTTDDENVAKVATGAGDSKSAHRNSSLTGWEKKQVIREVKLKGVRPGRTILRALLDGRDWVKPLDVEVVNDPDSRRVGKTAATVSPTIKVAIQGASLRDAVLMVAEDQMNSAIARTSGYGRYDVDPSYEWCGAFAHWCWKMAAAIKGVNSPFGTGNNKLLSPQKAISWAMQEDTPGQLLRYHGHDPMKGGKQVQEFREIGFNGCNLERGDIILVRAGHAGGWKHVCMVDSIEGETIKTMEGNQGLPQSIKRRTREQNLKLGDGSYAYVYVHAIL